MFRYPINRICLNTIVEFKLYKKGEQEKVYQIKGRKAQTLLCLVEVGARGFTSAEVANWAYRLASYIYDLRHGYNIDIHSELEPHEGGRHARYTLLSLVEIIAIIEPKKASDEESDN